MCNYFELLHCFLGSLEDHPYALLNGWAVNWASATGIREASRDDRTESGHGRHGRGNGQAEVGDPDLAERLQDKVLELAAAMPETAAEAQLELIEQSPAFKDPGKADIDAVKEAHKSTLAANENSQERFYRLRRISGTPWRPTSVGTTSAGNNERHSTTASTGTCGR
jgi:hypothetical protein